MQLEKFNGEKKEELSMIEVARAILEQKGETMAFADLVNAMQTYLGKSDEEIRDRLSQFYTDLNINGAFISLGDNVWGLRSWYPFESVDEEVNHPEDEEERPRRKKRKKVNAFLADVADDDDVIDYNDDDPEDDDSLEDEDYVDDEGVETDEHADAEDYNSNMSEVEADDDDPDVGLPDGIEGQLAEFGDDDEDDEDDIGTDEEQDPDKRNTGNEQDPE